MGKSGEHLRTQPRTPLSLLVQYRFHPYEDYLYEYTGDISPGGVFLRTEAFQPVGTTVYLQFSLRDGSFLIEAVGRVARITRPGKGENPGMGVQFTKMEDQAQKKLERLCLALKPSAPTR
jgi:uncharacterized protein (TIGR02266 family)